MAITFKEFYNSLITEMLKVDDKSGKVIYTTQREKFGSSAKELDTFIGTGWYKEHTADSGNVDIYSRYLYKHSPLMTNILQALKGSGPLELENKTRENFLKATAKSAADFIKNHKIDTIIFPASSSSFLTAFVNEIHTELGGYVVNIVADAIIKKQIKDIDVEKGDMTELFNFDHKSFHTLSPASLKSLEKQITRSIKDNMAAGKGNVVSVKDLHKMQAKFVMNYMELVKDLSDDLDGKNILIIDDILSSGSTFAEMVRVVQKENVKSVIGLTIFKNTSEAAKKESK